MLEAVTHLMAVPLTTPALGVELAKIGGELEAHTGEAPFDDSLVADLQAGKLQALEDGRARLAVRLQELAASPNGGEALSRFTERVRKLRQTGEVHLPTYPVKELIARYIREGELFEKFRMQINDDELQLLGKSGWDAVWDQMTPEHFMEVWIKVMGNRIAIVTRDEMDAQDRRAIGELLTLGLAAKSHNYSIQDGDVSRFEELIAKAMRVVRNQTTVIGQPRPDDFGIPLLVDKYFRPETPEREWFDIEWRTAERRHEGTNGWERLNAVIIDRLRTADQLPMFVTHLYEHAMDGAAKETIERSRPKVKALLELIKVLKAEQALHLSDEEWGMVDDLQHFYDARF